MNKANKTLSLFAIMFFFLFLSCGWSWMLRALRTGHSNWSLFFFAVGPLITYSLYVFTFT